MTLQLEFPCLSISLLRILLEPLESDLFVSDDTSEQPTQNTRSTWAASYHSWTLGVAVFSCGCSRPLLAGAPPGTPWFPGGGPAPSRASDGRPSPHCPQGFFFLVSSTDKDHLGKACFREKQERVKKQALGILSCFTASSGTRENISLFMLKLGLGPGLPLPSPYNCTAALY